MAVQPEAAEVEMREASAARSSVSRIRLMAAVAAIASGGMLAVCYRPLNLHGLAWVALTPWLFVLPRLRPGGAFLGGTLLGLSIDWA